MNTIIKEIGVSLVAILALLALLVAQYEDSGPALGGAPLGQMAITASTSRLVVGTSAAQMIATSTCISRIITTEGQPIKLSLGDEVPTALLGFLQAASSTEKYDSGLFGCGTWRAISASGAATNITLVEFLDFR